MRFFLVLLVIAPLWIGFHFNPAYKAYPKKPGGLWTADWSPDDRYIAVGGDDSLLRIYETRHFKLVQVVNIQSMIRQVRWHPTENLLAIATHGDALSILNPGNRQTIRLKNVPDGARAIGWNFNGKLLAAADNSGTVRIWDRKGTLQASFQKSDGNSYFSLDWHPRKNLLITGGDDIRIFDEHAHELQVIKHRKEDTGVLAVRWHPSGNYFVSGDYGHDQEGVVSEIQFRKERGELIRILRPSKKEYRALSWSHNGLYLASSGDALRIWTNAGKLLFTSKLPSDNIWGLAWNRNNTRLVSATFDGVIQIWTKDARLLHTIR